MMMIRDIISSKEQRQLRDSKHLQMFYFNSVLGKVSYHFWTKFVVRQQTLSREKTSSVHNGPEVPKSYQKVQTWSEKDLISVSKRFWVFGHKSKVY